MSGVGELFLAPEGAMQCEISVDEVGPEKGVRGIRLWVAPDPLSPKQHFPGCRCTQFFRVLHIDEPRYKRYTVDYTVVCPCICRFVE
jgi:hypothetical protein